MKTSSNSDPAVAELEAGLTALHQKRWAEAEQRLLAVVNQDAPRELQSRARQWLEVARSRAAKQRSEETDPYLRALVLKNQGDSASALGLLEQAGETDERCLYLRAALHAAENQPEEAARWLRKAILANPANRVFAFHDSDFSDLRRHSDFVSLLGLG